MPRITYYRQLEPLQTDGNLDAGFAAVLHDPVWMLARQWQMGEYQGENAASPVRLIAEDVRETPLQPFQGMADQDPTKGPVEPMVEAEEDSWWTMGRRVRIGALVAQAATAAGSNLPDEARFQDHQQLVTLLARGNQAVDRTRPFAVPPYEHFVDLYDGLTLWRRRAPDDWNLPDAWFGPDLPPTAPRSSWQESDLFYEAAFETDCGELQIKRHNGGTVDWFSADLANPVAPVAPGEQRTSIPVALQFPGGPLDRWWAIEDAQLDIGGTAPDRSHFPTLLLIDLICSHSRDWFLARFLAHIGHILSIGKVTVLDCFGEAFEVRPPDAWSLFQTSGLSNDALVVWPAAENPLNGPILEQVQLGIDEYENILWAVERRVLGCNVHDGTAAKPIPLPPGVNGGNAPRDLAAATVFQYLPAEHVEQYWHPYVLADGPPRVFVHAEFRPFPDAAPILPAIAEVLGGARPVAAGAHRITPATVPASGMELVRHYALARDTVGNPRLWIQRERRPLLTPPALATRFDVLRRIP
jgi:hypothetical protein